MKTTDRLLAAAAEIWKLYHTHPFTAGIRDGTLDREKFRAYLIQDLLYLRDYARTFCIGAAKAASPETAALFTRYAAVANGELDIHSGYLGRLGITQAELADAKPSLANLSYTSYMLRVAYEDGETEILTAVLACAYSYEVIAKRMVQTGTCADNSFYADWIHGYASKEYADENAVLLDTLDRLTSHCSEWQLRHLEEIFVTCSRYELAFWEMAWQQAQ